MTPFAQSIEIRPVTNRLQHNETVSSLWKLLLPTFKPDMYVCIYLNVVAIMCVSTFIVAHCFSLRPDKLGKGNVKTHTRVETRDEKASRKITDRFTVQWKCRRHPKLKMCNLLNRTDNNDNYYKVIFVYVAKQTMKQ